MIHVILQHVLDVHKHVIDVTGLVQIAIHIITLLNQNFINYHKKNYGKYFLIFCTLDFLNC
jgi:hypothetical protein